MPSAFRHSKVWAGLFSSFLQTLNLIHFEVSNATMDFPSSHCNDDMLGAASLAFISPSRRQGLVQYVFL